MASAAKPSDGKPMLAIVAKMMMGVWFAFCRTV
jgi:hypothetical protein